MPRCHHRWRTRPSLLRNSSFAPNAENTKELHPLQLQTELHVQRWLSTVVRWWCLGESCARPNVSAFVLYCSKAPSSLRPQHHNTNNNRLHMGSAQCIATGDRSFRPQLGATDNHSCQTRRAWTANKLFQRNCCKALDGNYPNDKGPGGARNTGRRTVYILRRVGWRSRRKWTEAKTAESHRTTARVVSDEKKAVPCFKKLLPHTESNGENPRNTNQWLGFAVWLRQGVATLRLLAFVEALNHIRSLSICAL